MRGFWSRKLPAGLLAAVMALSLTPVAFAADCGHNNWSAWQKLDDSQHQRKCLTSGCAGTQEAPHKWAAAYETDAGSHWQVCSDCGAQTAHTAHTYSGTMKSDSTSHWDECTVCGYKDNLGGHMDPNNDGKCDTCGYSMGTASVTVTFVNGSRTYKTQSVKSGSAPSNPGTPTRSSDSRNYTFKGWTTKDPGSSALYTGQSYLTSSEVSRTSVSGNTTYYALYTKNRSSSGDITYEVDPGKSVSFDRADFKEFFEDECDEDDTFRYVIFYADSSLKSSNGKLYHDYEGKDEETFSRSDLEDYEFYYKSEDYLIDDLTFVADEDADGETVTLEFRAYGDDERVDGTVTIEIGDTDTDKGDITYKVDPDDSVDFDRADFKEYFDDEFDGDDTFRYVVFYADSSLKSSNGRLYHDYDGKDEEEFSKSDLEDYEFYYKSEDYLIDDLTFVADEDADGKIVTLEFTAYGDDEEIDGVVKILIGDVEESDSKGDINYTVEGGEEVEFDRSDFNEVFKEEYSGSMRYLTFYPDSSYKSSNGTIYYDYDGKNEEEFSRSELEETKFYYSSSDYGDYPINDLTFVADDDFDGKVTLEFRAWFDEEKYVDGTLVISSEENTVGGSGYGNIRYYVTTGTAVQINANDIARFFSAQYPGSTLEYVKLMGIPSTGTLYYDYYSSDRMQFTVGNCDDENLYFSPSGSKYSLHSLTYIPSGSNYCASIPFTAYGSSNRSVQGSILISVTKNAVSEVYGVTPKNTAVTLPASAIYSTVYSATGTALASIQLLELPEANVGSVTVSGGYVSLKANTTTRYGYGSGDQQMSQLRFTPATGYTGSVEIPYVAYDKDGDAIAAGKFCLGVVTSIKRFSDVSSSSWCYKYVTELSDAGIIGGYSDGTFKPDNTVTYGAALKLVMLAAGYPEQKPTGSHTFSGYLSKAQSDGLVSGSVNLDQPITRLQVSQLAAKAMKLDISNLSSTHPFTDTADVYVQALNAAGIVEGYFSNGTSTFKPSNTLTRGQLSAIVWRMRNYEA